MSYQKCSKSYHLDPLLANILELIHLVEHSSSLQNKGIWQPTVKDDIALLVDDICLYYPRCAKYAKLLNETNDDMAQIYLILEIIKVDIEDVKKKQYVH